MSVCERDRGREGVCLVLVCVCMCGRKSKNSYRDQFVVQPQLPGTTQCFFNPTNTSIHHNELISTVE